jgi:hypothetical protein
MGYCLQSLPFWIIQNNQGSDHPRNPPQKCKNKNNNNRTAASIKDRKWWHNDRKKNSPDGQISVILLSE